MSFIMNSKIKPNDDIYEILFDKNFYNIIIDNIEYSNYIIYKDSVGVEYKVFIHDSLLYNNIEFFVDKNSSDNRFIIIAYKENMPTYILLENNYDNDNVANNYIISSVGSLAQLLSDESSSDDILEYDDENEEFKDSNNNYPLLSYETIRLIYNDEYQTYDNPEILDDFGNPKRYKIYNKENSQPTRIVRHYKVIKVNKNVIDTNLYNGIKYIEQNPENNSDLYHYEDNMYQDKSIYPINEEKNKVINKIKYKSFEEFTKNIDDLNMLAKYSYVTKVTSEYSDVNSFKDDIDEVINKYNDEEYNSINSIYIRLAPSLDEKEFQVNRALDIKGISLDIVNNKSEYAKNKIKESDLPIWNDNLFYSEHKYDYIRDNLENEDMKNAY